MKSVVILPIIWRLTAVSYAEDETQFSNTWVAKINGGPSVAGQVAEKGGFSYKGSVIGFKNYYKFIKDDLPEVLNRPNPEITKRLMSFPEVKWAEQQQLLKITVTKSNAEGNGIVQPQSTDTLNKNTGREYKNQTTRDNDNELGKTNLNIVYKKKIIGKDIVIAVVDTRVKKDHPDLQDNLMSIYGNYCTIYFSYKNFTSDACLQASGIITLTQSANPNLTNRDMMHLITMSTEIAPVADNDGIWYKNDKGFWVSNDFGFGLLNAENMLQLAKNWRTVPKKTRCEEKVKLSKHQKVKRGKSASVKIPTLACLDTKNSVNFLEQLEVTSTIKYPYRGALNLAITSPSNTKTILLETRPYENSTKGVHKWSTKSLHSWGEDPKGVWEIEVKLDPLEGVNATHGTMKEFSLIFHGTAVPPRHFARLPRTYSAFRLPNDQTDLK